MQPVEVYVDDESKLTLHGLVQHYTMLTEDQKNKRLMDLLDQLDFNQVPFCFTELCCISIHWCMKDAGTFARGLQCSSLFNSDPQRSFLVKPCVLILPFVISFSACGKYFVTAICWPSAIPSGHLKYSRGLATCGWQ